MLRAAFRVQQGETVFEAAALFCNKKGAVSLASEAAPKITTAGSVQESADGVLFMV